MKVMITATGMKARCLSVPVQSNAWVYIKHKVVKGPGYRLDRSEDGLTALIIKRDDVIGVATVTVLKGL